MGREEQGLQQIEKIKILSFGVIAGFVSAALGLGGGVVLVSTLISLLNYDIKKAVGTSLATAVPIAFVGLMTHAVLNINNIKFIVAFFAIIGSIVGVRFGIDLFGKVSGKKLERLFAIFLFFVGLRLVGVVNFPRSAISQMTSYPFLMILGLLAGSTAALFGIGGGILMVPCFYLFFGLSMHEAIPTSLLVILPTIFIGAWFHRQIDNVRFGSVRLLVPIAPLGAVFGAILAVILPEVALRTILGLGMVVYAIRIFI